MTGIVMGNLNTTAAVKGTTSAKNGNAAGFKQALHALNSSTNSELSKEEVQAVSKLQKILKGEADFSNMEDLLSILSQLFEQIPLQEGYLSTDMLKGEAMSLLKQLPEEKQNEILALFQSEAPLEDIIGSHQDPLSSLITSLIALDHFEQTKRVDLNQMLKNIDVSQHELKAGDDSAQRNMNADKLLKLINGALNKVLGMDNVLTKEKGNPTFTSLIKQLNVKLNDAKELTSKNMSTEIAEKATALMKNHPIREQIKTSVLDHEATTNKVAFVDQGTGPMNRIQQYVIHMNQGETKSSMQQQFIEQFQQIMKQSKFVSGNNQSQLTIRLNPDHLGSLSVKLTQMNGEMMARMIVSSNSAKELIESSLHQLRHVFSAQNIQVDKIEVMMQNNPSFNESLKEQEKEHEQSEQSQRDEQDKEDEDNKSFEEEFEQELLNLMA